MTKSKFAFESTAMRLFDTGKVYLWTFTFPDVCSVEEASYRWSELCGWFSWCYRGAVVGIRVYEMHQTHGMHVHALIIGRLDVNMVRVAAKRYGFGRINVKAADKGTAKYLAKYLGKSKRHIALRGRRLWSVFGRLDSKTRVSDVAVGSAISECFKFARLSGIRQFAELSAAAYRMYNEMLAGRMKSEFIEMLC